MPEHPETAIQRYCSERRFKDAIRARWLLLEPADGVALLTLASELRLGENQLRDLWNWGEEIAQRDGLSLAAVLTAESILACRGRDLGRNDKLAAVKRSLRRIRFPELSRAEDEIAGLVRALALPRQVRVQVPELLEGDGLRIEIAAASAAELERAAAELLRAAATPECREIFARLG